MLAILLNIHLPPLAALFLLIHSALTNAAASLLPFLIKISALLIMISSSLTTSPLAFSSSYQTCILGTQQLSPYDLNQRHIIIQSKTFFE